MTKFNCDSKYLVFPVNYHSSKKKIFFYNNGELIFDLDIQLDYKNPDFYSYINVERFSGLELSLEVKPSMHFEIRKSNLKYENEQIYNETYRPNFHFTAKRGWLNDPNGLLYYNGVYHMFFQHNTAGHQWGNMHWGHAISRDLLHWEEKECALYPDELGTVFSGSAIVDKQNVSGLKQGAEDPIIIFYTAAGDTSELSKGKKFTQCIAYSADGGETFETYKKNPIIENIIGGNRDPKVQFDEKSGRYIMSLYLDADKYCLFYSKNLLEWRKGQEISLIGDAECPDFYPLAVDGDKNNIKWVFSGASDRYLVGDFDGNIFTPQTESRQLHYGKNSYASQTFSSSEDSRKLRISWNTFELPGMPFNKSMTFPGEMSLKSFDNETILCINPVREIKELYKTTQKHNNIMLSDNETFTQMLDGENYDITLKISSKAKSFDIELFGLQIHCASGHQLSLLDCKAPIYSVNGETTLRMLIDKTGIEIYIGDGRAYLSVGVLMDYNLSNLEITPKDGTAVIKELSVSPLNGIWENKA